MCRVRELCRRARDDARREAVRTPLSCAAAKIAIQYTHRLTTSRNPISLRTPIQYPRGKKATMEATINHSDLGVGHGTVCSVTVVEREPNRERSSPQQPERRLHDEKGFPREGVLRLVRVQAS